MVLSTSNPGDGELENRTAVGAAIEQTMEGVDGFNGMFFSPFFCLFVPDG